VRVLVSGGYGLSLAPVGLMLVLGMLVRMSVDGPVGMAMLVLVLRMDVRMRVHDPIGMLVLVGVFRSAHSFCIYCRQIESCVLR
jgi:hypothetical protein